MCLSSVKIPAGKTDTRNPLHLFYHSLYYKIQPQSDRESPPYPINAIPRAAHGKAVRCPLPGKCLLIQARQPLAGLTAQKENAGTSDVK